MPSFLLQFSQTTMNVIDGKVSRADRIDGDIERESVFESAAVNDHSTGRDEDVLPIRRIIHHEPSLLVSRVGCAEDLVQSRIFWSTEDLLRESVKIQVRAQPSEDLQRCLTGKRLGQRFLSRDALIPLTQRLTSDQIHVDRTDLVFFIVGVKSIEQPCDFRLERLVEATHRIYHVVDSALRPQLIEPDGMERSEVWVLLNDTYRLLPANNHGVDIESLFLVTSLYQMKFNVPNILRVDGMHRNQHHRHVTGLYSRQNFIGEPIADPYAIRVAPDLEASHLFQSLQVLPQGVLGGAVLVAIANEDSWHCAPTLLESFQLDLRVWGENADRIGLSVADSRQLDAE